MLGEDQLLLGLKICGSKLRGELVIHVAGTLVFQVLTASSWQKNYKFL